MQRQCRTVIPAALSAVTRRLYTAAPPDGVPAAAIGLLLEMRSSAGPMTPQGAAAEMYLCRRAAR